MIRLATETDLPAIDRIYNQAIELGFRTAHTTPLDLVERSDWFRNHEPKHHPVFVCIRGNDVVGWASFSAYRPGRAALDETAELSFYVDTLYRGQGIGSEMMEHCLKKCRGLHKRVLFSIIIEGNNASIRLLQKFGFDRWGYLPEVIHYNKQVRGQIYMGKVVDSVKP